MTWMKWRATWAEGAYDSAWDWFDLGVSGDKAKEAAEELRQTFREDHRMRYPDGFRTIEYELVEVPPAEVLQKHLKDLEDDIAWKQRRVIKLRRMLSETVEDTDTTCSVCGSRQFNTTSGVTCPNGHGGAPPNPK